MNLIVSLGNGVFLFGFLTFCNLFVYHVIFCSTMSFFHWQFAPYQLSVYGKTDTLVLLITSTRCICVCPHGACRVATPLSCYFLVSERVLNICAIKNYCSELCVSESVLKICGGSNCVFGVSYYCPEL